MSQEKVDKYKKEKATRKASIKKQKRNERIIVAVVIVFIAFIACCFTYKISYSNGHDDGYQEAADAYYNYYSQLMSETTTGEEATTDANSETTDASSETTAATSETTAETETTAAN